MAEFHFLRPAWLAFVPVAIWLAWRLGMGRGGRDGWRAVVDKPLQRFVLAEGGRVVHRRWPLLAATAATILASLALAGPTWERLPVPAYRSNEALVVALDLSRSMDAGDVEPSRLVRARLKLLDLLERRKGGQTALVVFTSNAFTVTPLTTDTKTIAALVNSLSSDIMPSRGSLLSVGIDKAAALLRQSGAGRGEILLITDGTASPKTFDLVGKLAGEGVRTHVLAVGTEEGAPIPKADGGFVTDAAGQVVVPQVNVDNLRRLAAAGGGRFARLAVDETDLDRLFPSDTAGGIVADSGDEGHQADIWRDEGIWLALALLPLIALAFRRGWVYVVVAAFLLPLPRAEAFGWRDLWQRPDQQGMEALKRDDPAAAAELFKDPEWSATAKYRAGQYEASADTLAGLDTETAQYNRGNALARAGQLEDALSAYDRALELDPDDADAKYNRDLVADLLEKQQEQQQSQQGQNPGDQNPQSRQDDQQQADQQASQQSNQGDQSDQSQQPREGNDQQQAEQNESRQGPQQDRQAADRQADQDRQNEQDAEAEQPEDDQSDEPGDDRQPKLAAAPDDVEDWASEQAAEQWLRRIPQDPGGLLRRKFLYQYQQEGIDQDGNRIYPGDEVEPW